MTKLMQGQIRYGDKVYSLRYSAPTRKAAERIANIIRREASGVAGHYVRIKRLDLTYGVLYGIFTRRKDGN